MVGLAASDFSFAAASGLLWELAAVRVETKQVERAAEALGRKVAADERDVAETVPSPAPTMYLGLDGGAPRRGRRPPRQAQPDGSAKTREVKLATMWTAEGRDKAGRPVRDRGSVSYNAAVESAASRDTDPLPSAFAQRAYREAQRRGFDTAARRVVIGDGAPWIWQLAAEQFPGAIEIIPLWWRRRGVSRETSTTPSSICATWPTPERTWPTSGPGTGVPSWTPAGSAPSSRRYASMSRPRPRREGAFTMCSGTDTACAIRSSAPRACASLRASSRPDASRSAHGSSAPACAGPSPAPTPSSPSAAACSAAASRTSGRPADLVGRSGTAIRRPDVHLVRHPVTSLSPSQSSGERFTTTAPSLVGTHGYAACVATVAMESDTRDNCSSAVYVTVHARASSSPNLQVIRARVSDSTPTVGQQFRMYADVVNVGPAGSASTLLRYWRRPAGGGWDRLSSDTVGTISPGRYRGLSRLLMAPSRSGRYEYTACVNRVLGESNTDDNCFRPFLTVTVGDEGGQECTTNWGTLSTGRNVNGSWTGRCRSRHYSGVRYARYYSFTIRGRTSVTIDLTSPSVDTWLALYTGGGFGSTRIEADDDDGDGQNARITRTLEAGTYTIEATTWALMATGSFTLTVAPQTVAPQSCTNHLGTLSLSTVVRDGAWTGQCLSVHDTFGEAAGHYNARYYSFTLTRTAAVTLDLTSSTVGTWMALYHGSGTGSSRIVFNNDGGTGTNARIVVRELSAGTYTIEATTRWGGVTGSFRLTVTPRAADAVGQQAIVAGPPLEGTGGDPGTAKGEAMQLQPGTAKGEAMQLQPGTDQR